MGKLLSCVAVALGAGLLMAGSPAPAQDQQESEKRLKELEAARAALEKRLGETEKASQESRERVKGLEAARASSEKEAAETAARLKALEAARASLEKRAADAETSSREIAGRLKELEASRAAFEKRFLDAERFLQESSIRLKEQLAAQASLEKRVTETEKGRQDLLAYVRDLIAARAALEKRLTETEKASDDLAARFREQQSEQRAAERRLDRAMQESEGQIRDLRATAAGLGKRLSESEGENRDLVARVRDCSDAGEQERRDRLQLRAELQRLKLALRAANEAGFGDHPQTMASGPVEEHYASLGLVYEYLGSAGAKKLRLQEGEGLRILRIPLRTFAHETDLYQGDSIVRVNGTPVRSTGVRAPRIALEKWWEQPQDLPNFVIDHLPGETVELEYVRDGVRDRVQLRLACTKCGKSCAFYGSPR